MKWIEFNETIRSKSVGDILKLVRLPLLEPTVSNEDYVLILLLSVLNLLSPSSLK